MIGNYRFNTTAQRLQLAKFRNTSCYDKLDDVPVERTFLGVEHSDLIDGNCFVARRDYKIFGTQYVPYFIDVVGYISIIKAGLNHDKSMEEAVTWLQSSEFWVNKERYIAECDLPRYLYDTEVGEARFIPMRNEFIKKYSAFLRELGHDRYGCTM